MLGYKKKNFLSKLLHRYRLVIIDEDTLEQKFSVALNQLNTLFVLAGILFFGVGIGFSLIWLGPSKYLGIHSGRNAQSILLSKEYKDIKNQVDDNQLLVKKIQQILKSDFNDSILDTGLVDLGSSQIDTKAFAPTMIDSVLRVEVEREDKADHGALANYVKTMQAPVKAQGVLKQTQNTKPFLLIKALKNAPVYAVDHGKVIYIGHSPAYGYVLVLQHNNGLVSIYKNNEQTMVRAGSPVKKGQEIAKIGETKSSPSGNYLQFEVWQDGYAKDPVQFIKF